MRVWLDPRHPVVTRTESEARMSRSWERALAAAGILALSALALRAMSQDRATIVPGMKVLLDNDCVRVQYHDVGVGQKVPLHAHPNYVVYTLTSYKARITVDDGAQRISEHQAGEAYWNPAITHSVENLGSTPIHNVIMELKPGPSCH
jgi:beta-alanine degradation protein BauB